MPKFATSLISFIRRLREHHNTHSAMLVHCSAGVGRTGAFILLDSMLERMMSEKTVNVYEFLTHMREQRVHMVQTLVSLGGGRGGGEGGRALFIVLWVVCRITVIGIHVHIHVP